MTLPLRRSARALTATAMMMTMPEIAIWAKGEMLMTGRAFLMMPRNRAPRTAPGTDAAVFPDGYGMLLKKGTTINFQMHYHKTPGPGTGQADRSEIAFVFHDKPVDHELVIDPIANGRFEIPPMTADWRVGMARILEKPITIVSLMPHTHLRGTRAKYVAYYPDGTEELLLNVPKYDFNWQTDYKFVEPKTLPAGTRLEAEL